MYVLLMYVCTVYVCIVYVYMYECMYVFFLTDTEKDETVLSKLVETKMIWTKGTGITEHQHCIISYDFHFSDVIVKQ